MSDMTLTKHFSEFLQISYAINNHPSHTLLFAAAGAQAAGPRWSFVRRGPPGWRVGGHTPRALHQNLHLHRRPGAEPR